MTENTRISGTDATSDPAESIGAARAVPVQMFDCEYTIMSDKPRLVKLLAEAVNDEARRIRETNPSFHRGIFNWPVEVAFKMALDRYNAQRELADCRRDLEKCRRDMEILAAKIENDAEKLARLIDAGLGV
jgi:hypothetical protein